MPGNLTQHHFAAFFLTYCIYSIFHASRKAYSDSKKSILLEWTPLQCNLSWPCPEWAKMWNNEELFSSESKAEVYFGLLDTVFLTSYAIGMYFTSYAADRCEKRKVLALGMWISGVLLFIFGVVTQWFEFYNKAFYAVMWSLQGVVQSIGWPSCIAVVGNWFGKSGRGLVFGIWASCASVGNILGNVLAASLIFYGYEYVFLTISLMMFCGGIVVFFGLVNSPEEIGLRSPDEGETEEKENEEFPSNPDINFPTECDITPDDMPGGDVSKLPPPPFPVDDRPLTFCDALLLPGVISYSLSFACLKLVNYAFLFWLPFYLTNTFHWDEARSSSISTLYDVGGIIGGVVCGILSDRLKTRSPVLLIMMVISPFALWGYRSSPNNVAVNSTLMAIVGFFINGVSNILSSATAVDLSKQERVGKNGKVLATVTGIIDGTGSLGAAVGQYAVAVIQTKLGWGWVFNFFIIANIAALLLLVPVFYRDFEQYFHCQSCNAFMQRKRGYIPIDGAKQDNNSNDDD